MHELICVWLQFEDEDLALLLSCPGQRVIICQFVVEGQDFLISRRPNNLKCIGSEFFRICLVGVKGEWVVDVIIIYGLVAVEVSVCHLLRFPPRIHQQVSDLPLDLIRDLKPGAEADVDVNVPYIQCLCLRHHLAQIIVQIPSHVIQ